MGSPIGAPVPFRITGSPDDAANWILATLTNSPEEAVAAAEICRREKIDCEVLVEDYREDASFLFDKLKLSSFGSQRKLRIAFKKLFGCGISDGHGQEYRKSADEHGRSQGGRVEHHPRGGSGSSHRNGSLSSPDGGLRDKPTVTPGSVSRKLQVGRDSMVENSTPASQLFSSLIDSSLKGMGSERKFSGASASGMAEIAGKCGGDKDTGPAPEKGCNLAAALERDFGDGGHKMHRAAGTNECVGVSPPGGEMGTGAEGQSDGGRQLQQGCKKERVNQGSGGNQTLEWRLGHFGGMEPQGGPRSPSDSFCLSEPANISSGDESDCVVVTDIEADSELENHMVKEREQMEDIVSSCSDKLREFRHLLKLESDNLASAIRTEGWLKSCEDLERQLRLPSTTIGVVGISGAGKSTLVNAILNDTIVPTSGMKACTSTVIKLSYNQGGTGYEGTVTFISREDWRREIDLGLEEVKGDEASDMLLDEGRNLPESEKLSASKLIAVYGKEALKKKSVTADDLMKVNHISQVLDTTLKVCAPTSKELLENLKKYMSSCSTSELDGGEYWPLVKKVHVKYRWPALACGAKLVDLPGTRDSNAARNQVADTYLKKCNVIWVVAEMKRAMSDAESCQLLGDNFRRQVLMDGSYNKIAFICTMIDNMRNDEECEGDLSVSGICEAAGVSEEEFQSAKAKRAELLKEKMSLVKQREAIPWSLKKIHIEIKRVRRELRNLGVDSAGGDAPLATGRTQTCSDGYKSNGNGVSMIPTSPSMIPLNLSSPRAPTSPGAKVGEKRKLETLEPSLPATRSILQAQKGKKRGGGRGRENVDTGAVGGQFWDPQKEKDGLLKRLRELKKQAEDHRGEKGAQTSDHHSKQLLLKIRYIQARIDKLSRKIKLWCILGRNARAKSTIKQSFVDNLGGPDGPHRHKDSLDVPVFCVSASEALALYRKVGCGQSPSVFKDIRATGIPEVREYVHKTASEQLLDVPKAAVARLSQFLEGVCAYLCDVGLNDGALCERVQRIYKKHEGEMQLETKRVIEETHRKIDALLETQILKELQNGVRVAEADALEAAQGWHKRLMCITYKAACKPGRDGVFVGSNKVGPIDFNEDLAKPILDKLTIPWDQVMNDAMFTLLAETRKQLLDRLDMFFGNAKEALCEAGISDHRISRIEDQARKALENLIRCHMDDALQYIHAEQKDISRELVPEVQSRMKPVYEKVVKEAGKDSYKRMKQIMSNFISQEKGNLFQKAAEVMLKKLKHLVSEVKEDLDRLQESIPAALAGHYGCFFDRPVTSFDKRKRDKAITRVREIAACISRICIDANVKVDFRCKSLDFGVSRRISGCSSGDYTGKRSGSHSREKLFRKNGIPSLPAKRTVSTLGKELLEAVMADTNRRSAARPAVSNRTVGAIPARTADWPLPSFNRNRVIPTVRASCGLGIIEAMKCTESKQKRVQSSAWHTFCEPEEQRRPMDPPKGLALSNLKVDQKNQRAEEERKLMKSPTTKKRQESKAPSSCELWHNPASLVVQSLRRGTLGKGKESQKRGAVLKLSPQLRPCEAVPSANLASKGKRQQQKEKEKREKNHNCVRQEPPVKKQKFGKEEKAAPAVVSHRLDNNAAAKLTASKQAAVNRKRLISNKAPVAGSKMQLQNRVMKKLPHAKRHKQNDVGGELCLRTPSKPVVKTATTYFAAAVSGKIQSSSDREDDDDDADETSDDDSDESTGKAQSGDNGKEEEEEEEEGYDNRRRKHTKQGGKQNKVAAKCQKGKGLVRGWDVKLRQSKPKKRDSPALEKRASEMSESEGESDSEDGSEDQSTAKDSRLKSAKEGRGSGTSATGSVEGNYESKHMKGRRPAKKKQRQKGRQVYDNKCEMKDSQDKDMEVREEDEGSEDSGRESGGENSCDRKQQSREEEEEEESEDDKEESDDTSASSSSSSGSEEEESEDEEGEEVNMRSRGRSMFF